MIPKNTRTYVQFISKKLVKGYVYEGILLKTERTVKSTEAFEPEKNAYLRSQMQQNTGITT